MTLSWRHRISLQLFIKYYISSCSSSDYCSDSSDYCSGNRSYRCSRTSCGLIRQEGNVEIHCYYFLFDSYWGCSTELESSKTEHTEQSRAFLLLTKTASECASDWESDVWDFHHHYWQCIRSLLKGNHLWNAVQPSRSPVKCSSREANVAIVLMSWVVGMKCVYLYDKFFWMSKCVGVWFRQTFVVTVSSYWNMCFHLCVCWLHIVSCYPLYLQVLNWTLLVQCWVDISDSWAKFVRVILSVV